MKIQEYAQLLQTRQSGNVQGLCGRIIRGKKPIDFLTLTDDPHRKLVMLMGPDGLQKLLGKSGYDMLIEIGYEKNYIVRKVKDENCQFKLVVFGDNGPAKLATWDNTLEIVSGVYPEIAAKLKKHARALATTPFDEIERQAGFDFSEVDKIGESDPRYLIFERYKSKAGSLIDARAFLYFTVHLRELFSGDGYTYTADGKRGMMEYIVPNLPITDLGESFVIDLNIEIPQILKGNQIMKTNLPLPKHFDASLIGEVRRIEYQKLAEAARDYARKHGLKPAATDKFKICVIPIDCMNTFCIPGFELFVGGRSGKGAVEDNERLCRFIYQNLGYISAIAPTLDTHIAMQIFHEMFWVNDQGEHPAPMTNISLRDVETGIWKVNPEIAGSIAKGNYVGLQKHVLHYCRKLSDNGKYLLTIWPYHAMLGGIGHALVSSVEEAIFFHNIARRSQTNFQIKGGNPLTENYSIFKPEVLDTDGGQSIAQKNSKFLANLLEFDAVIIAGQAKSHCVAWTIDDLLTEIKAQDESLAKKVYLLADCTSPVVVPGIVDFTDQADAAFQRFAAAGMHIVRSTEPIDQWPGINL